VKVTEHYSFLYHLRFTSCLAQSKVKGHVGLPFPWVVYDGWAWYAILVLRWPSFPRLLSFPDITDTRTPEFVRSFHAFVLCLMSYFLAWLFNIMWLALMSWHVNVFNVQ